MIDILCFALKFVHIICLAHARGHLGHPLGIVRLATFRASRCRARSACLAVTGPGRPLSSPCAAGRRSTTPAAAFLASRCDAAAVLLAIRRVGVSLLPGPSHHRRICALYKPAPLLGLVRWHYLCCVRATGLAMHGAKPTLWRSLSCRRGALSTARITYSLSRCPPP